MVRLNAFFKSLVYLERKERRMKKQSKEKRIEWKKFWIKLKMMLDEKYVHSKKNRLFTEPQKRFRRFQKASKSVQKFQKKDKKIYETFNGSYRVPRIRTFCHETFF